MARAKQGEEAVPGYGHSNIIEHSALIPLGILLLWRPRLPAFYCPATFILDIPADLDDPHRLRSFAELPVSSQLRYATEPLNRPDTVPHTYHTLAPRRRGPAHCPRWVSSV
jgi:hypothetical protein